MREDAMAAVIDVVVVDCNLLRFEDSMPLPHASVHDLLVDPVNGESIAVLAPGRTPLRYAELAEQVRTIGAVLRAQHIAADQRVAVALPNGAELGVAVLGTAAYATCAPLDAHLPERVLREAFETLHVDLVIAADVDAEHVHRAAEAAKVPCLRARWNDAMPAGQFALPPMDVGGDGIPGTGIALLLRTSGTTGMPKRVPLTHAQLCASAANIAASLHLAPEDRCLNVMPLFHVHGLIGALLASLHAGASVVCTPGMRNECFVPWLREFDPTWYTAVPTMHRSIAGELQREGYRAAGTRLRFVRSCSSALAPALAIKLEQQLGVPVVEAYGMTEAAHQVSSNPLPPSLRAHGSVGVPTGTRVAIMSEDGERLPAGQVGQVGIRGETIIERYDEAAAADSERFVDGWFLTGDQGVIDANGHLRLVGRLKDVINRGGEKISPQEVEFALLEHEAVLECTVFGVDHPSLGQDLCAAVMLDPSARAEGEAVRQWLSGRLPPSRIPRRVFEVDALPRSTTGKVARAEVALALASRVAVPFVAPRAGAEARIARAFAEVLELQQVGAHDNFFLLGGDSLRGAQVLARLREQTGAGTTLATLFQSPTPAQLAVALANAAPAGDAGLIPLLSRIESMDEEDAQALLQSSSPLMPTKARERS